MGPVWTIVVAAGAGRRFGSAKQFEVLAGRTVVDHAVAVAAAVSDGVVLVVPAGCAREALPTVDALVDGGDTRTASVARGLAAVPDEAAIVVVHDGARPLAGPDLFRRVVTAVTRDGVDGAVPALPVTDTVKRVDGETVAGTVDRADLVAVQTPQAFRASALRRAYEGGGEASDDAALVEASGGRVVWVEGDGRNAKITTPDDLARAEWHLARVRP